jgi:hypothetical protein
MLLAFTVNSAGRSAALLSLCTPHVSSMQVTINPHRQTHTCACCTKVMLHIPAVHSCCHFLVQPAAALSPSAHTSLCHIHRLFFHALDSAENKTPLSQACLQMLICCADCCIIHPTLPASMANHQLLSQLLCICRCVHNTALVWCSPSLGSCKLSHELA